MHQRSTIHEPMTPRRPLALGKLFNLPNQLTSLRLLLSVVLFGLIVWEHYLTSLVLFIVAAGTDWLDGYYARKYGQVTTLGRILDPFADKVIVCGTFIFLAADPATMMPDAWLGAAAVDGRGDRGPGTAGHGPAELPRRAGLRLLGQDVGQAEDGVAMRRRRRRACSICTIRRWPGRRLGLLGLGDFGLGGGGADGIFGRGIRVCRHAAVAPVGLSVSALEVPHMHLLAKLSPPMWVADATVAVVAACLAIWLAVIARWWMGRPAIPYQPRRPVPWSGGHIVLMVVIYFAVFVLASPIISHFLAAGPGRPEKPENEKTLHAVEQMLVVSHWTPYAVLVALLAVVFVAPVVEEFFFRVLLQGWLETVERRHRRAAWLLWRALPGAGPIVISSLVFGPSTSSSAERVAAMEADCRQVDCRCTR